MNNLGGNLINKIYDYSIGDKKYWKSKFKDVINEITYFNADDIVCEYFSKNHVKHNDLEINIINCWFHLDYKFKEYIIKDNHQYYNAIEYYLLS